MKDALLPPEVLRDLREKQRGPAHALPLDGVSVTRANWLYQMGAFDSLSTRLLPFGRVPADPGHALAGFDVGMHEIVRGARRLSEIDPEDVPREPEAHECVRFRPDPARWR